LIAVSQALHWRTGHKNDCLQIISSAASNSVLPAVGIGDYLWITKAIYALNIWIVLCWQFFLLSVPASISWPEFEIKIDYEGTFDSDSGDENNSKSLVMQRHGKPDAMMQSWMDHFEVLFPFSFFILFRIISAGFCLCISHFVYLLLSG
jgi:pre-rRNA-processing protein TSR4